MVLIIMESEKILGGRTTQRFLSLNHFLMFLYGFPQEKQTVNMINLLTLYRRFVGSNHLFRKTPGSNLVILRTSQQNTIHSCMWVISESPRCILQQYVNDLSIQDLNISGSQSPLVPHQTWCNSIFEMPSNLTNFAAIPKVFLQLGVPILRNLHSENM